MGKLKLVILLVMFILSVSLVSASQTFYATDTKYRGALYGKEGQIPCGGDCYVHDCAWFSVRVDVAEAGSYNIKIPLIRDGYEQSNENIRIEANGKAYYQYDDGSYTSNHEFGPFYLNKGNNEIKFSSTRHGDFYYKTNKDDCYYGSVHLNQFTITKCPDTDKDNICDYYDYCIGENYQNLPDDTLCRNWFISEIGCHDYTNKEFGSIVKNIDCDYFDTSCRNYYDTADKCNGYGGIISGSCDDYDNMKFGTSCGGSYFEYSCYAGSYIGSDVYRRLIEHYCDGSGSCKEKTSSWEIYEECDDKEFCYIDDSENVRCKNPAEENICPKLEEIEDIKILEGELIELDINATDLNGDELTFYYSAPFDSEGKWQTAYKDSGNYTIELNVSDGYCQDSWTFNVEVLDNKAIDLYCFPKFNESDSEIEIKSVEVNDINIDEDIEDRLAIERGEELYVKVRFTALKNISELMIESYLDVSWEYDYKNVSGTTVWFDVEEGTTYTREIILNVPDDLEQGIHNLKIIFHDKDGLMDTCNYEFKITLPIYSIIIKEIKLTPEVVKAGRVMIADVELKNIGNTTIENIDIVASIPEFNMKDSDVVDELRPGDSVIVKDLVLRIPSCSEEGEYFVKAIAEYEYETISKAKLFYVKEGEGCSEVEEDVDEFIVLPEAQNIIQGDVEVPFTLFINNPSDTRKTYILTVDGVDPFGEYRIDPSNVLIIPAKKSQTAFLYIKADIGDIYGPKPVVVTARTDTELKEIVTANIIQAEKEGFWVRFCNYIKDTVWYTFLLILLILIIFFVILFLLLKRDEEDEEENKR